MLALMVAVCAVLPSLLVSAQTAPDWRPCGDFPWDTDDVTVGCDYTYTDVKQWHGAGLEPPLVLQGRCTVTCPPEADMLVGPPFSDYRGYRVSDGTYYCNVGNSTWMGSEPVCLGGYSRSTVITDDTNTVRLVGGEFYGCVELYDDVTGQWGPVRGINFGCCEGSSHYEDRMSWADLACRNLGLGEGLATWAYTLSNGVFSNTWIDSLQDHYYPSYPSYPSTAPKFMVNQTLPQWENATLHDAIDRVVHGPCAYGDCSIEYHTMCLACAGERTQDGPQDLAVQVTCTSDHLEVSFPRPPDNSVQAADVQLAAPPCRAEQNSTHIYIRTPLGECGTTKETTPAEMIYRNTLTVGADPLHGGITWQQLTKVPLECRLPRNKTLSLDFRPHLKSVFRSGVLGEGEFRISMELFRTDGFRQPVTEYPVFVELQEMIHVQIQVNSSDADLQVFPRTCVATPSDDPSDKTRNDVIVDGCAKLPTLQFYPSPGPDRGRFGFQAFAYTSGVPTVYLHCDVLLCKASDPNSRCAQGCQTPSGRRRREAEGEPEVYRLIQGPIVLGDDQTGRKSLDLFTVSGIMGACALLLAAAMFVLGVLYKARREGRQSGYRVLENTD